MDRCLRTLVLAACAPLLGLWGCSESLPTEIPSSLQPAGAELSRGSAGQGFADLVRFHRQRKNRPLREAKWIGPEGGRLDFQGFAIEVPEGAVTRRTQFSIHIPADPHDAERVVADFGPHGVAFAVPVAIELPYSETAAFGDTATIVYWRPPNTALGEIPARRSRDDGPPSDLHPALLALWPAIGRAAPQWRLNPLRGDEWKESTVPSKSLRR